MSDIPIALPEGRRSEAGTLHRIPAAEIEEWLIKALKALDVVQPSVEPLSEQDQMRRLIDLCVARVIVDTSGGSAPKLGQAA